MATKKGGKAQAEQHHHSHAESIDKMVEQMDGEELEQIYAWVDEIPFSRPKRNISRDFSDGVLLAELVHFFFPGVVDMHNYSPANNSENKTLNWKVLNRKVFNKLNFELAEDVINDLVCCKAGMIEKVLLMLRVKISRAEFYRKQYSDKPEADQHQHQHQHQHAMSPGRKDQKTIKVGMDSTKGKSFKTKHVNEVKQEIRANKMLAARKEEEEKIKFDVKSESHGKPETVTHKILSEMFGKKETKKKGGRRMDEFGHMITHRYLDKKGWNSGAPESKQHVKTTITQKKRTGPVAEPDLVSRLEVEEKEQEVLARDETINIMQAKISRLEHLLHLKDMRIDDLQNRVESTRPTGIRR